MIVVNSSNYRFIVHEYSLNKEFIFDFQPFITYTCIFIFLIIIVLTAYYLYRESQKAKNITGNSSVSAINDKNDEPPDRIEQNEPAVATTETTELSTDNQQFCVCSRSGKRFIRYMQVYVLSSQNLKRSDNIYIRARRWYPAGYGLQNISIKAAQEACNLVSYGLIVDPPSVYSGEMVNIFIGVLNMTPQDQSCTVNLSIAGRLLYTENIYILPHKRKNIRFPMYTVSPGEYTIDLNGVTAQLRVLDANTALY